MNRFSATRRRLLSAFLGSALLGGAGLAATAAPVTAAPVPATGSSAGTVSLTIRHLDRAGRPAAAYETTVTGLSGAGADASARPYDADGTVTVRLPRGRYVLDSALTATKDGGTDWIVRPRLDLVRDTTVTVDARTARPVDVRPPDAAARFRHGGMFLTVSHGGAERFLNRVQARPGLRVAHLGPAAEPGSVRQWYDAYWSSPSGVDYALGHAVTGDRALTGLVRKPAAAELATLRVRATRPGTLDLQPSAGPTVGISRVLTPAAPATYRVTPGRGTYDVSYAPDGGPRENADGLVLRPGRTTVLTFPGGAAGR
ncbi:hypothetical protein [Streptomyces tritici]|uniref:hypothetical protein n=1 Tax=Streptomyces tritici TaxID=2054410 RepID=UPI003AF0B305